MPEDELDGLEPAVEDPGLDPASDAEAEPQEETVDPRDSRLDALEAALKAVAEDAKEARGVKAAIGRLQSLEANLGKLSERDPLASVNPRLSTTENLVVSLAQTLANSSLVEDADRAAIHAALRGIEAARTDRELEARFEKLQAQMAPAVQPQPEVTAPIVELWNSASAEIREMAQEYGVAPEAVPWNQIQTDAGNDPARVVRVALKWFESQKAPDSTTRVAERRRAAGAGSPAREGAQIDDNALILKYGSDPSSLSDAQRERAEKAILKMVGTF